MLRIALCTLSLLLVLALGACPAEQSLTVTLDPPPEQATPKTSGTELRLSHETHDSKTPDKAQKQYRIAGAQAKATGKKDVSIGWVGVVTSPKADITSLPAKNGRKYFTCPKDTYLAVVGENKAWYGILMVDSSVGWVEKSKVALMSYRVMGQPTQRSSTASRIVNTALKYLGIPYRWGGYSTGGIDCSGFVKAVFASNGIQLPRVSRDQANVGTAVTWNSLQPGDRLYFACKGGPIDHAGIYLGNGLFIHSSVGRGGVAVDNIMKPFFLNSLVSARRS